jgi:hypothetical protein
VGDRDDVRKDAKVPTGRLESLRNEVEVMIAATVADRHQELETQLSQLLEIGGGGNGTHRAAAARRAAWQ